MTPINIAEGTQMAKLYEDRPVRMQPKRHPRLKENVRTCLRREFCLVRRIGRAAKRPAQSRLIVGREQDNNCRGGMKSMIEHLSHVRRTLVRAGNQGPPLKGAKTHSAKKLNIARRAGSFRP